MHRCVANFDDDARNLLWAEAVNNANDGKHKSPRLFTGEKSRLYSKLVELDELVKFHSESERGNGKKSHIEPSW
jgi:hypothetical protein